LISGDATESRAAISGSPQNLSVRSAAYKRDAPGWRDLVPVLIGAPDYPVVKTIKSDVCLFQVNDGLHFNAVVLLPPKTKGPKIAGVRQSKLKESLVLHVNRKEREYLNDKLYRIHVTPMVKGTSMAEYTFKAFIKGRISSNDIVILN
jgi:hypothetical protein